MTEMTAEVTKYEHSRVTIKEVNDEANSKVNEGFLHFTLLATCCTLLFLKKIYQFPCWLLGNLESPPLPLVFHHYPF